MGGVLLASGWYRYFRPHTSEPLNNEHLAANSIRRGPDHIASPDNLGALS